MESGNSNMKKSELKKMIRETILQEANLLQEWGNPGGPDHIKSYTEAVKYIINLQHEADLVFDHITKLPWVIKNFDPDNAEALNDIQKKYASEANKYRRVYDDLLQNLRVGEKAESPKALKQKAHMDKINGLTKNQQLVYGIIARELEFGNSTPRKGKNPVSKAAMFKFFKDNPDVDPKTFDFDTFADWYNKHKGFDK